MPEGQRTRVWDVPTRAFHWLFVAAIAFAWWTAETDRMDWHLDAGYVVLGLLVFRIYWGFVGSSTARFASFVRGPQATLAYIRTLPGCLVSAKAGHNPLGAWSILAMLALVIAQVTLGLFAVDVDGISSGPLSDRVSFDTGRLCAEYHDALFNVLLGLIALHVAAVLFYLLYKGDDLIGPMVHGKRRVADATVTIAPLWRAVIGVLLAAGFTWFVTNGLKF
ncbi:MAG: cytochrome b/b6 domain-containing protein [Alphaproteobacteria bacterium]|nr:cytochrome b/b6 domain-containing protein [Alphaproteobacteria bacterium]